MTKLLGVAALAVAATMVPLGIAVGQTQDLERRIYSSRTSRAWMAVLNFDPPMTLYGHLELPRPLASAHYSVVRWLARPE